MKFYVIHLLLVLNLNNIESRSDRPIGSYQNVHPEVDDYHRCLNDKEKKIGDKQSAKAEALIALEKSTVIMDCFDCRNPKHGWDEEVHRKEHIVWKRKFPGSNQVVDIEIGEEKITSIEFKIDDDGSLYLTASETLPVPTDTREVQMLAKFQVGVKYEWSAWSDCDTCGEPGQKVRTADCIVTPTKEFPDNVHIQYISIYYRRLPCQTIVLPEELQKLSFLATAPKYQANAACEVRCPKLPSAESSEYPVEGELPPLPPGIATSSKYKIEGESVFLTCSQKQRGSRFWRRNVTKLTRTYLQTKTTGRLLLTKDYGLVFSYLELEDAGLYSCWNLENQLLKTVYITVERRDYTLMIMAYSFLAAVILGILLTSGVVYSIFGQCGYKPGGVLRPTISDPEKVREAYESMKSMALQMAGPEAQLAVGMAEMAIQYADRMNYMKEQYDIRK